MDTIYSNSGLSLTQDQYFQIVNGRLRAIQADTTNNQVKLFFEKKENDAADNDATSEHLVFDVPCVPEMNTWNAVKRSKSTQEIPHDDNVKVSKEGWQIRTECRSHYRKCSKRAASAPS